jgi:hypothetical protein
MLNPLNFFVNTTERQLSVDAVAATLLLLLLLLLLSRSIKLFTLIISFTECIDVKRSILIARSTVEVLVVPLSL